jgi:hypothetical protein
MSRSGGGSTSTARSISSGRSSTCWCRRNGDLAATTHRFFAHALPHGSRPAEGTTDRATAYPRALDELVPAACHVIQEVREQPHRIRSQPSEVPTTADARSHTAPLRTGDQRRTRVRAEHPPRPRRTRDRGSTKLPGLGCLRRAGPGDLTNRDQRSRLPQLRATQRRPLPIPACPPPSQSNS